MANTREIPREDWSGFLNAFSRLHRGASVRTEVFGQEFGAQEASEGLPLVGIAADFKDVGEERIAIALGRSPDDHLSHAVVRPARVRLLQDDQGIDEALEIESADGASTLLRILSTDARRGKENADRELESARPDRR